MGRIEEMGGGENSIYDKRSPEIGDVWSKAKYFHVVTISPEADLAHFFSLLFGNPRAPRAYKMRNERTKK